MRNLIPPFLLHHLASGHTNGHLEAVVLFVDTSGFTPLTARLSTHGRAGAETLAEILLAVFAPLVRAVYAHGGFIAGFAGDAFKAVFPGITLESYLHALSTAAQIRTQMAQQPIYATRYGEFAFSVRMSLAAGQITWLIWSGEDEQMAQSSGYTFSGPAIDAAIQGEDHAEGGEVVVTTAFFETVRADLPAMLTGERLKGSAAGYVRIDQIADRLVAAQSATPPSPAPPADGAGHAARFYPESLLTMTVQGEFRPVYTLFLNVASLPAPAAVGDFLPLLLRLLAQYGGYLCRIGRIGANDPGGTFLLFWGAPTSHENDLARVLSFVLDLQSQLGVPMRAGVTHAVVYAGFIGSTLREEYTCYGTSVNQAARQMVAAQWGQILLDQATARRAEDAFDLVSMGTYALKGLAAATQLFALRGRRTTVSAAFYDVALVGRSRELNVLLLALQPIVTGRFGGMITIQGEAGIGKSRLVHEALAQFAGDEAESPLVQTVFCPADEILRASLNPFRYFLRRYFHQEPTADEVENKARFSAQLDSLPPLLDDEALAEELMRTRSFLGALLDLHWDDSLYERLEPRLRFDNTLAALKTLFKAESRRRPLIIHLEDLHWFDADSLTFLATLLHNVDEFSLMVVATTRPLQDETTTVNLQLPAGIPQQEIALTALDTVAIAGLAEQILGGPASASLVALIEGRTQGNPFFVEQLLHYLQERQLLIMSPDTQELSATAQSEESIPEHLQTVLIARLDRLTQAVRDVVQTAAVLGREFSVQVLSQMLHTDMAIDDKVRQAQDAAIWSALSELRYLFRHVLLRDAAYAMQLQARLRILHHAAGSALEALYADNLESHYAALAYHFDRADDNARAVHYLQLASYQARDQYRNADVLALIERLLPRLSDLAAITDARINQCNTLIFVGRNQEALSILQETAQLVADLPDRLPLMRVQTSIGSVYWRTGRKEEALAILEAAESLISQVQDQQEVARVYQMVSIVYGYFHLDYAKAVDYSQRALAIFTELDARGEISRTLLNLGGHYRGLGNHEESRRCFEQSLAVASANGDVEIAAQCYGSLSIFHALREEFPTAITLMEKALPLAKSVGSALTTSHIYSNLAKMYIESGRHRDALPLYAATLETAREMANPKQHAVALNGMAQVYLLLDRLAEAEELAAESVARREQINDQRELGLGLHTLAMVLERRNHVEAALRHAERALPLLQQTGNLAWNGRLHGLLALLYAKSAQLPQALSQVVELLDLIAQTGQHYVQGLEHVTVALVLQQSHQAPAHAALAPSLARIQATTGVPNTVPAHFEAAIVAAEAAGKWEIAVRARCEAARYWHVEGAITVAQQQLAVASHMAHEHDLLTAATEVQQLSAVLGNVS